MGNIFKKLKLKRRLIATLAGWHFYGNPSKDLKIVGVTGTNGKTTTATLLYKIATELGYKAGLMGTVENIIVDEVRPATHTTPSPIQLNALLREMVARGCEYVFMEVSSHSIDQNRIAGVNFVGGIFTNLTHDHLDYHKTMENYFAAKKKFFAGLSSHAFALANADDEYGKRMLHGIAGVPFRYGFEKEAEFEGKIDTLDFNGLQMQFNDIPVQSKLLGKFNAYNLLAVWSACSLLGFDMASVNTILAKVEPPRGRFDYFLSNNNVMGVVDFAHTPDALEKILLALREVKKEHGKIIAIFGCGGNKDSSKRHIMGSIGATLADIAVFSADNPRQEDPKDIIEMMKKGLTNEQLQKVKEFPLRQDAIAYAASIAKPGDIILAAGKGHENEQEIKGVKYHFNDMEILKKALS